MRLRGLAYPASFFVCLATRRHALAIAGSITVHDVVKLLPSHHVQ